MHGEKNQMRYIMTGYLMSYRLIKVTLEAQKELLTQYALNQGYEIEERKPQCLWLKGTHE